MDFSDFLLNEDRAYLGVKLGDILNAIQDITDNAGSIGQRMLVKNSEQIVNQIRRILHTSWPKSEQKTLEKLQKVAVNIMKAIEEKGDLPSVLQSASGSLEEIIGKMETPINQLAVPDSAEEPKAEPEEASGVSPSQGAMPKASGPKVNTPALG
jgi:hypothetical protein